MKKFKVGSNHSINNSLYSAIYQNRSKNLVNSYLKGFAADKIKCLRLSNNKICLQNDENLYYVGKYPDGELMTVESSHVYVSKEMTQVRKNLNRVNAIHDITEADDVIHHSDLIFETQEENVYYIDHTVNLWH